MPLAFSVARRLGCLEAPFFSWHDGISSRLFVWFSRPIYPSDVLLFFLFFLLSPRAWRKMGHDDVCCVPPSWLTRPRDPAPPPPLAIRPRFFHPRVPSGQIVFLQYGFSPLFLPSRLVVFFSFSPIYLFDFFSLQTKRLDFPLFVLVVVGGCNSFFFEFVLYA